MSGTFGAMLDAKEKELSIKNEEEAEKTIASVSEEIRERVSKEIESLSDASEGSKERECAPNQCAVFGVVLSALKKAAAELNSKNKEEARKTIAGVSTEIQLLCDASQERARECEVNQRAISVVLADVLKTKTQLNDNLHDLDAKISESNVELAAHQCKEAELGAGMAELEKRVRRAEADLAASQSEVRELHDTSWQSVLRSVFTGGMDRAIIAIRNAVWQSDARVDSAKDEIARFSAEMAKHAEEMKATSLAIHELTQKKLNNEVMIEALKQNIDVLQAREEEARRKFSFFTTVHLFYGKLLGILEQTKDDLSEVVDIVEELNDDTPTIDALGDDGSLFSLRETLERFDAFLTAGQSEHNLVDTAA